MSAFEKYLGDLPLQYIPENIFTNGWRCLVVLQAKKRALDEAACARTGANLEARLSRADKNVRYTFM